jgi:muramoyltetrapeptide carboxypeptidase LdcA involved in peptidoglycan recycling
MPADSKEPLPYVMAEVIETLRRYCHPHSYRLPFGHVWEKITIPVDGVASVNITNAGFQQVFCV